jgi:hypothetical protein
MVNSGSILKGDTDRDDTNNYFGIYRPTSKDTQLVTVPEEIFDQVEGKIR